MEPTNRNDVPRRVIRRRPRVAGPTGSRQRSRLAAARMSLLSIAIIQVLSTVVGWSITIMLLRMVGEPGEVAGFIQTMLPWIALSFAPGATFFGLYAWSRRNVRRASITGLVLLPTLLLAGVILAPEVLTSWVFWGDTVIFGFLAFGLAQGLRPAGRGPGTPLPVAAG